MRRSRSASSRSSSCRRVSMPCTRSSSGRGGSCAVLSRGMLASPTMLGSLKTNFSLNDGTSGVGEFAVDEPTVRQSLAGRHGIKGRWRHKQESPPRPGSILPIGRRFEKPSQRLAWNDYEMCRLSILRSAEGRPRARCSRGMPTPCPHSEGGRREDRGGVAARAAGRLVRGICASKRASVSSGRRVGQQTQHIRGQGVPRRAGSASSMAQRGPANCCPAETESCRSLR